MALFISWNLEGLFAASIDFYSKQALLNLQHLENVCAETAELVISLILYWSGALESSKGAKM